MFIPCLFEFFLLERCTSDITYFQDNTLVYFYQLHQNIQRTQRAFSELGLTTVFPNGFPMDRNRSYHLAAVVCGDHLSYFASAGKFPARHSPLSPFAIESRQFLFDYNPVLLHQFTHKHDKYSDRTTTGFHHSRTAFTYKLQLSHLSTNVINYVLTPDERKTLTFRGNS